MIPVKLIFCRLTCASLEEKAKAEYDKVNEGMEEFNKKMKEIADAKDEKTKKQKKIVKYVTSHYL